MTKVKEKKKCSHKSVERTKEYVNMDCYGYQIRCKNRACKMKVFDWTIEEVEKKFEVLKNAPLKKINKEK